MYMPAQRIIDGGCRIFGDVTPEESRSCLHDQRIDSKQLMDRDPCSQLEENVSDAVTGVEEGGWFGTRLFFIRLSHCC